MKDLIRKDLSEAILALQRSIRIASVKDESAPGAPFGKEIRAALQDVLALGESIGFKTGVFKDQVGWIEYGEGKEMVSFLGHVDVVPAGEGWTYPPFGGEIHDGVIYGRGVLDDKGPVIAAIYALKALKDSRLPISKRVKIIIGTNEENGFTDMIDYVAEGQELPLMGFTSDACYPLLNREKGSLHLTCEADFGHDGHARVVKICGGTATNVVPSHASATLALPDPTEMKAFQENLRDHGSIRWERIDDKEIHFEATGIPEHGSRPEKGENAIMKLLHVLNLDKSISQQFELIDLLCRKIGFETDGESLGISMSDADSGALSLNLGTFQASENKASFSLDIRYPVSFKASDILPVLEKEFEPYGIKIHIIFDAPPLFVDPSSVLIRKLQKVYREQTGEEPELLSTGESTYAKTMPGLINFGPIFPEEDYSIHQADECWSVDSFQRNIQMMAAALYELAR